MSFGLSGPRAHQGRQTGGGRGSPGWPRHISTHIGAASAWGAIPSCCGTSQRSWSIAVSGPKSAAVSVW